MLRLKRRSPRGSVDRNFTCGNSEVYATGVAPHAGAWIETTWLIFDAIPPPRRSPRGSVDRNSNPVITSDDARVSLPTRERGSKHHRTVAVNHRRKVAPHAGAWIETTTLGLAPGMWLVAPHAGAWIETQSNVKRCLVPGRRSPRGSVDRNKNWVKTTLNLGTSLPTRERGSKQELGEDHAQSGHVAPHAGAWIETLQSYPAGRLKSVAPHAGAWIETAAILDSASKLPVAPHAGAWIETPFNA